MVYFVLVPDDLTIKARKFILDDVESWLAFMKYISRLVKDGHSVHVERDFSFSS